MQRMVVLLVGILIWNTSTALAQNARPTTSSPSPFAKDFQSFVESRRQQALEIADRTAPASRSGIESFFNAVRSLDFIKADRYLAELKTLRPAVRVETLDECMSFYRVQRDLAPQFALLYATTIGEAIPQSAVYFGGSAAGRLLPSFYLEILESESTAVTLSLTKLANAEYMELARQRSGTAVRLPTREQISSIFQTFVEDAKGRYEHDRLHPDEPRQILPGENIQVDPNSGRISISGWKAVMGINAMISREVFDMNPQLEFLVQESRPVEWMIPHLRPHGPILRLEREPVAAFDKSDIKSDHEYWQQLVAKLIGGWITYGTELADVCAFVLRVHRDRDFSDFKGRRQFIQTPGAQQAFSKLRAAIAGLYVRRINIDANPTEDSVNELQREAEFAFLQAFALCPTHPETVNRYAKMLLSQKRAKAAQLLVATALQLAPKDKKLLSLQKRINQYR